MVRFILNLPWTLLGLVLAVISMPVSMWWDKSHRAFIFRIKSFWWYTWLPGQANARAMAISHVVMMGPKELPNDLEHELIHVRQYDREPFIYPFLYYADVFRNGYRASKYESEAYDVSGNPYLGK